MACTEPNDPSLPLLGCCEVLPLGYVQLHYLHAGYQLGHALESTTRYLRRRQRLVFYAYPPNGAQEKWRENQQEVTRFQKWLDTRTPGPIVVTQSDSASANIDDPPFAPAATALDPIQQIGPHHWQRIGYAIIGGSRVNLTEINFYGELEHTRDAALNLMTSTLDAIPFGQPAVYALDNAGTVITLGASTARFAAEPPGVVCVGTRQHLHTGGYTPNLASPTELLQGFLMDFLSMSKERLLVSPDWCDVTLRADIPFGGLASPPATITEIVRCGKTADTLVMTINPPPEVPSQTPHSTETQAPDGTAVLNFMLRPGEVPWTGVARPVCCDT